MLGLGRMGANMTRRLVRGGAKVTGFDRSAASVADLSSESGFTAAPSLAALVAALPAPRVVWIMLPAGDATQSALDELASLLSPGDLVVDGGNANYKQSQRRGLAYKEKKLGFVDAGVSGGVWGLANGYCLMLGGERDAVARVEPFAKVLAPDQGWLHCGPVGSGHFVKMIHNGIEYGMMQAMAEGFALMQAKEEFDLDLGAIGELWRHGSVVRSWLLDLTADALKRDADMDAIKPVVGDNGEGRWTVDESVALGVPAPVIGLALMMRFATQGKNDYVAKLLATMRLQFGGHAVEKNAK
jgi:6-phosphogluconate dehydrogenase